jgi:hypothetical protein
MPREQRVRRDDGLNRRERPPPERLGFRGQADTLIVGESHSPGTELFAQHAVLHLEIVDHIALLLMDPAGHGGEEKLQGLGRRRHGPAAYQTRGRGAPGFNKDQSARDFPDLDRVNGQYAVDSQLTKGGLRLAKILNDVLH